MRSGGFPWLPPLLPDGSVVQGYEGEGKGMEVALTVKEGWWGKENNDRMGTGVDLVRGREREWGAVKVRLGVSYFLVGGWVGE